MLANDSKNADRNNERYIRWQERLQQQLGFLNNTVIGLGAGLIGFELAHRQSMNLSGGSGWEDTVIGIALSAITVSVALGLGVASTRLRSIRMTASRKRVLYLWQKFDAGQSDNRREDLKRQYRRWLKWSRISFSGKSRILRNSTDLCLSSLAGKEFDGPRRSAMEAAREWERGLDNWTWRLLWSECFLFGTGALMLALIPIFESLR